MEPVHFYQGQFPHFQVLGLDLASEAADTSGSIMGAIRGTLLPHDPNPLVAELHSMHIYRGRGAIEARVIQPNNEMLGMSLFLFLDRFHFNLFVSVSSGCVLFNFITSILLLFIIYLNLDSYFRLTCRHTGGVSAIALRGLESAARFHSGESRRRHALRMVQSDSSGHYQSRCALGCILWRLFLFTRCMCESE
jgi:hypothetical protein